MSFMSIFIFICILNFCSLPSHAKDTPTTDQSNLDTYIVHVEGPDEARLAALSADFESWYRSFLPAVITAADEPERMVYSYRSVFKGFAAKLSPEEVKAMEKKDGFISARPERKLSLHTTHSPNFLGLNQNMGLWKDSSYGKGVIIGLLDTGIFPDHPSFSDEGMPPPPAKWKGKCEFNHTKCNNKIIGARLFTDNIGESPLDDAGHGTHTASTAAGSIVNGANVFGNAKGTAVGVAPFAHLASYKVCSPSCSESNILAGMDAAIEDGVDVLSISLGGFSADFYEDTIALGAFSAMEKGILVSCSAGNSGPDNFSLSNEAPWILTVGASTIDRKIRASVVLGDDQTLDGESAFQPGNFPATLLPLVDPRMLNSSDLELPYCTSKSLNRTDIRGKVVVCEIGLIRRVEKGIAVKNAGGAAMILVNPKAFGDTVSSEAHVLPASHVNYVNGLKIKAYINSTSTPMATIVFKGTIIGDDHAPVVAAFSSRGPNSISPGILKPDIIGPGVNILAAWPVSVENNTNTNSTFNIISGTSMSCPHLSGIAALLKSAHPDWSSAAIKSAIMTTADVVNLAKDPIEDERFLSASVFATGSGHVNPSRANDPGLIYDIKSDDYIPYLCGLNYTSRQVSMILQRKVKCSLELRVLETQLNYPSFALTLSSLFPSSQTYSRTVTNVGEANSSYVVEVVPPSGIDVRVVPAKLEFSEVNQKMQYNVTFSRLVTASNNTIVQGFLKWNSSSSRHSARSPVAVILR